MLHISVNSLLDFMTCRRLYYYKRLRRYDRIVFDVAFIVGRVMGIGISALFSKKGDAEKIMLDCYNKEKSFYKKEFVLSEEQLEDLKEVEYTCIGMLKAYRDRYSKLISDSVLLGSEVEGKLEIDDNVTVVIKLDNLLKIRKKKVLHELKTSKYITQDYVRSIRTDMQHTIYYYIYNMIYEDSPIESILYDIVRKPSIRQRKDENRQQFLKRLQEWYGTTQDMSVFHLERFDEPLIKKEDMLNTILKVADEMLKSKTKEDYYQDFTKCHSYYGKRCPYYELCHEGGETKENLVLYQPRVTYRVRGGK